MAANEIPKAYELLQASAHHVEGRAATGLYNFLTANSLLVLSWSAIFSATRPEDLWAAIVMMGVSLIGVLLGFQWALLGTRTWHYALEYADQLRAVWPKYGLNGHIAADQAIYEHWGKNKRFLFSANHWVLFLAPLALSVLHMLMFTAVLWPRSFEDFTDVGRIVVLAIGWATYLGWLELLWRHCGPILHHERRVSSLVI